MMTFPTLGIVLGVAPFAMMALRGGTGMFVLGMLLSVVGLLAGFLLGLVPVYAISTLLERALKVGQPSVVRVQEHSLTLGGRPVPIADVLFVDRKTDQLVLKGGERLSVAPGSPARTRAWIAGVLRAVTDARQEGSAEDVPRALAAIKQPAR